MPDMNPEQSIDELLASFEMDNEPIIVPANVLMDCDDLRSVMFPRFAEGPDALVLPLFPPKPKLQ